MAQQGISMTTDELRDWHAREGQRQTRGRDTEVWTDGECRIADQLGIHPYPPTLDGAASAMPEGWVWVREYSTSEDNYDMGFVLTWSAYGPHDEWVKIDDTGDEIHDRYLLAKLAKEAMYANPR